MIITSDIDTPKKAHRDVREKGIPSKPSKEIGKAFDTDEKKLSNLFRQRIGEVFITPAI